MKKLGFIFIIIGLFIVQATVLPFVLNTWPVPNLLLLFVLLVAVLPQSDFEGFWDLSSDKILLLALGSGLLLDAFGSGWFGFWGLLFVLLAAILAFIKDRWVEPGWNYQTLIIVGLLIVVVVPLLAALVMSTDLDFHLFWQMGLINLIFLVPVVAFSYVRTR